jgi:hypothetical protein
MKPYPQARLIELYRQQMQPFMDPDAVTLLRWCDRVETLAHFNVARKGWSYEQAGTLIDEVRELTMRWREELPTWVVELPAEDGTVLSRHIQAPTYQQAIQLFD